MPRVRSKFSVATRRSFSSYAQPRRKHEDRAENMWHRLPACDCSEHRLEAYVTISIRYLFFARC